MRVFKPSVVKEVVTPRPWLRRPRTEEPTMIIIHATRGRTTPNLQYLATKNWMRSPSNNPDGDFSWGSSCDFVIGNEPGEIAQVGSLAEHASWSAGFGYSGSWGADTKAIAIEVAQSQALEYYDNDALHNLINLCEELCAFYNIKPIRLRYVSQTEKSVNGIVGHEDLANGRRLGKSDPGDKFPWFGFLTTLEKRLAHRSNPGVSPQDVQQARLEFGQSVGEFWLRDPSRGQKWRGDKLEDWRERWSNLFE